MLDNDRNTNKWVFVVNEHDRNAISKYETLSAPTEDVHSRDLRTRQQCQRNPYHSDDMRDSVNKTASKLHPEFDRYHVIDEHRCNNDLMIRRCNNGHEHQKNVSSQSTRASSYSPLRPWHNQACNSKFRAMSYYRKYLIPSDKNISRTPESEKSDHHCHDDHTTIINQTGADYYLEANNINDAEDEDVGQISKKDGNGKHTTGNNLVIMHTGFPLSGCALMERLRLTPVGNETTAEQHVAEEGSNRNYHYRMSTGSGRARSNSVSLISQNSSMHREANSDVDSTENVAWQQCWINNKNNNNRNGKLPKRPQLEPGNIIDTHPYYCCNNAESDESLYRFHNKVKQPRRRKTSDCISNSPSPIPASSADDGLITDNDDECSSIGGGGGGDDDFLLLGRHSSSQCSLMSEPRPVDTGRSSSSDAKSFVALHISSTTSSSSSVANNSCSSGQSMTSPETSRCSNSELMLVGSPCSPVIGSAGDCKRHDNSHAYYGSHYHHSPELSSHPGSSSGELLRRIRNDPCICMSDELTQSTDEYLCCNNPYLFVVAIDFGTTYSGYAFALTRQPESIHMMRRWDGGDPGIVNQKTPTTILLTPSGEFHSFGFCARDNYHDLDPQQSRSWLYFEKFKMHLHHTQELNRGTLLTASNGQKLPAMLIFTQALKYFKDHAMKELNEQTGSQILDEDVKWVITVPAIWRQPAKAFMRCAAYQAGIASPGHPEQLIIALEPEAASVHIRKLKREQLLFIVTRPHPPPTTATTTITQMMSKTTPPKSFARGNFGDSRYMVVDCGGGTVDITVHELNAAAGTLKELYKATGGPYGSTAVDIEFENILCKIFSKEFVELFKLKRPAGFVDLMVAFESRKRTACNLKKNPFNISLPYSFIDYYRKVKGMSVEGAIKRHNDSWYKWSSQGMLRISPEAMNALFQPVLAKIKSAISEVLNISTVSGIRYLFLVGGFAESPFLQQELKSEFSSTLEIIIPQDVGLAILKGAVLFGLDPTIVNVRRSRLTYGVGVMHKFNKDKHPPSKLVPKDGVEWCADVFDKFVLVDQSVGLGDAVLRRYTPAGIGQLKSVINFYCSENDQQQYVSDEGVRKIGTLVLEMSPEDGMIGEHALNHSSKQTSVVAGRGKSLPHTRREIQTKMVFGDTEIKVSALDVCTGKCVRAIIDFLNS